MRKMVAKTLAFALVLACAGLTLGQQQPGQSTKKVRVEEEDETTKPKRVEVDANVSKTLPKGEAKATEDALKANPKAETGSSKLEEMLAEALKHNPDLRVAAAKVAEADAELNRTRLQVTQKVVAQYYAIETQKNIFAYHETKYKSMQRANQLSPGTVSKDDVDAVIHAATLAKAKLAELEAQMPALLGKVAHSAERPDAAVRAAAVHALAFSSDGRLITTQIPGGQLRLWDVDTGRELRTGPMADRIRKALATPITVSYKGAKLTDVLKDLEKKLSGLPFHDHFTDSYKVGLPPITLSLEQPLPAAAVLQALEDLLTLPRAESNGLPLCFVVRQYGIVAVARSGMPPGAVTVEEFLRQKSASAPAASESKSRNPPREQVEGVVKAIDPSGRIELTIGSDAGLAKGHTLELFRLSHNAAESKYLGTIRILDLSPKEAIAQPIGRLADKPRVGDRAASRIERK